MKVTDIKTQMHMQEWGKLIEARQSSGLGIKQWCQQNNVPESQYYYYLRKLRLAACESLPKDMGDGGQFARLLSRMQLLRSVKEQAKRKYDSPWRCF